MSNVALNQIKNRAKLITKMRPTLAQTVIVSTLVGVLVSCFVAGYYAKALISSSKLVDNWAIMFLESENMGYRLKQFLDARRQVERAQGDLRLSWDSAKKSFEARGSSEQFTVSLGQIGYDGQADILNEGHRESSLILLNGAVYMVVPTEDQNSVEADLKKIPSSAFAEIFGQSDRKARLIYAVSKQGRLIYSSDGSINNGNFISRELVKKFIQSSLTGQIIEYEGRNNKRFFGAVHEITGTNLVLFSEVSKEILIGSLTQTIQQYALLVVILVTATVILISFPITKLSKSLNILTRFARHLGTGDFGPRVQIADCAETALLAESLNEMAQSIQSSNDATAAQMHERLESVAWTVKSNLMKEVSALLELAPVGAVSKRLLIGKRYISQENFTNSVNFDLSSGSSSLAGVLLSEISADAAEALVYQTIVSGVIKNSIKNTFDDVRTIVKKIEEIPPLIGRQSVESNLYHIARSQKGGEIFIKIWSRFGLSLCGVQAPLTESGAIDLKNAIDINLGQRTLFETVLLLRPGDIVVLACHPSHAAVLNEMDICADDLLLQSRKILESLVFSPDMDVVHKPVDEVDLPQDIINHSSILVIGQVP